MVSFDKHAPGTGRPAISGRKILAAGASRGGVADVFRRAVIELRRRGHDVEVVTIGPGPIPALAALMGLCRVRRSVRTAATVHIEFGSNDVEVFWFALLAGFIRADCVVVAHDHPKLAHAPALGLVPNSSHWLRTAADRILVPLLDRPLVSMLVRRCGVLVVLGEEARQAWLARGARAVEVVAHGSDTSSRSLPASRGQSILFAGYLSPHKGLDTLFEAWQRVSAEVELPLLIAGGAGPLYQTWLHGLERRFGELPNPPRFLGRIDGEQAFQQLVDHAAMVVMPYRFSSPASGILLRAMSAARPVIATPVPAATAAIADGENGVLVPIDDPASLAEAIVTLYHSPAERDRLGESAARTTAERFTWDGYAEGLERAYGAARVP